VGQPCSLIQYSWFCDWQTSEGQGVMRWLQKACSTSVAQQVLLMVHRAVTL